MVNFAAGGIATPADAALMMQLGVDGEQVEDRYFLSLSSILSRKQVSRIESILLACTMSKSPCCAAISLRISTTFGRFLHVCYFVWVLLGWLAGWLGSAGTVLQI